MTGTVLVVGAMGQIGRPVVRALAEDGWRVRAASLGGKHAPEWPPEVTAVALDRDEPGALAAAVGDGCDVLVDCVAYGEAHARQLIGLSGAIGSAIVVSTVGVYEDGQGRDFDTQGEPDGFPRYPVPISETCPTVAPGDGSYGTRKAALEQELLAAADRLPTTLLRAAAIHGPFSRTPRELYFVKRALDKRPTRVLAYGGTSRFQPVHTANIAELVRLAAGRPGARALNAGDPQAPTVAEIGAWIDEVMGHTSETVLVDGGPPLPGVGDSPWSVPLPVVVDMSAAERELGYRAVTGYRESLPATVESIVEELADRDWRAAYPKMAKSYGDGLFDYASEDRWLAERANG
jgi:nucleoside-diphosphate-sugar epimerase